MPESGKKFYPTKYLLIYNDNKTVESKSISSFNQKIIEGENIIKNIKKLMRLFYIAAIIITLLCLINNNYVNAEVDKKDLKKKYNIIVVSYLI